MTTDTPVLTYRRTAVPDNYDPGPELLKHFTPQQVIDILKAVEIVKSLTGHGEVTVQIRNGHPRFVVWSHGAELKP